LSSFRHGRAVHAGPLAQKGTQPSRQQLARHTRAQWRASNMASPLSPALPDQGNDSALPPCDDALPLPLRHGRTRGSWRPWREPWPSWLARSCCQMRSCRNGVIGYSMCCAPTASALRQQRRRQTRRGCPHRVRGWAGCAQRCAMSVPHYRAPCCGNCTCGQGVLLPCAGLEGASAAAAVSRVASAGQPEGSPGDAASPALPFTAAEELGGSPSDSASRTAFVLQPPAVRLSTVQSSAVVRRATGESPTAARLPEWLRAPPPAAQPSGSAPAGTPEPPGRTAEAASAAAAAGGPEARQHADVEARLQSQVVDALAGGGCSWEADSWQARAVAKHSYRAA
jgi:hypothetical protein